MCHMGHQSKSGNPEISESKKERGSDAEMKQEMRDEVH